MGEDTAFAPPNRRSGGKSICSHLLFRAESGGNRGRGMRKVFRLDIKNIVPTREEVLQYQGMAGRKDLRERISRLLDTAIDLFEQLAEPRGLFEDLDISDFEALYPGEGLNAADGPVPGIVPRADAVALFAATMGEPLAAKAGDLFKERKAALGFMLDAVNSAGAERLGRLMCRKFLEHLPEESTRERDVRVQYYCPGHCGWHMSGQEKLFERLRPEEIGITLRPNWVMEPFKSISGILVAGDIEIHRFSPGFSFCPHCREKKCIQRLRILEQEPG